MDRLTVGELQSEFLPALKLGSIMERFVVVPMNILVVAKDGVLPEICPVSLVGFEISAQIDLQWWNCKGRFGLH